MTCIDFLSHAGAPSIALSSAVDVTSGGDVCPNLSVEFTCIAIEVPFFSWSRNGMEIEDFNSGDPLGMSSDVHLPYSVFLDTVAVSSISLLANFTSRLRVNLSDLMRGDNISCSQSSTVQMSMILSYTLRGNQIMKLVCMCCMQCFFSTN